MNTGIADIESKVNYSALYLQDQWTLKRLTLSGAIRYDHATSNYTRNVYWPRPRMCPCRTAARLPVSAGYCTPPTDGVSYNDVTPRWGVAWDVFGNGKTSIKWNMGKYLAGAGINGIYADANPAQRTVNELTRTWTDSNGNRQGGLRSAELRGAGHYRQWRGLLRRADLDWPVRTARAMAATRSAWTPPAHRSVWPPPSADEGKQGIPADVQAYCAVYGDTLIEGSGKRRSEWQFGLGIQHEILPRLSAEVTYNRRKYSNLTVNGSARHRLRPLQRRTGPANLSGRRCELQQRAV